MCNTVIMFARNIPNFNLASWDVIVDSCCNVKIIEVNLVSQGTHTQQLAFGSFFGKYTEDVINWVVNHKKMNGFEYFRTF